MEKDAVEVWNLYKSFGKGNKRFPVIKGISMRVSEGEYCAIVGESGSGKSTLLNLLAGFDTPDSGSITVFGKNIGRNEEEYIEYRRKNIGFIFQAFHLIPELTVIENIAFPLTLQGIKKSVRIKKAEELLEILGLAGVRNHTPEQISGGQKQRAAIGRALITEPKLILADEPTGNLDSVNSRDIIELLESMVVEKKKTLIMVTHDQKYAKRADRLFRVVDGTIKNGG